mmetsp:Transcript_73165/g.116661  ORF Transcript_73165/g.116661 Transcript_73165/m.116661 type:complete len:350 (-) Transcript_73165:85-1134(-)|eukprot:CAMPEP_0197032182 /NCGR_PEP_ID=MMETSP1384-20130603/10928_1 /TAXON_ID=29189 /ORGANISM="Ammonia sp." /LENGTH=349 /DNA_ID=CAMNT_0042461805 /DNA_START=33 /DNA_END=1082 /DNA_ORIENTATION=-
MSEERQSYGSISDDPDVPPLPKQNASTTEAGNFWGMLLVTAFLAFWTIGCAVISYQEGSTLQWFISRYIVLSSYSIFAWLIRKPENHRRFYGDTTYDTAVIFVHATLENIWVYSYFYALHTVYLGDIESIFLFVAPNVIALIGKVFFKEEFPNNILLILLIDVVGVVFVTQPSFIFHHEQPMSMTGLALTVVSTLCYSLDVSLISQNEHIHWTQMQITTGLIALVVVFPSFFALNTLLCPESNLLIGGEFNDSWLMIVFNVIVGIVSILSQLCLIYGYQMGASTKVVWLEYVNLIFAYSIQWIVFREIRNLYEIIGAVLIASTFFILFFQQYKAYDKEKKANTQLLLLN